MEPKFKTSFIPKKSLEADVSGTTPGRYVNRRTVNGPGFYLTFVVFLFSVGASVGIFGYTEILIKSVTKLSQDLNAVQSSFRPENISTLKRVDARLNTAKTLLSDHVATSRLFDMVEEVTLKKVRYLDFSYANSARSTRGEETASAFVTIQGEGANLKTIAQQVTEYAENNQLHSPVVNTLARGEDEENPDIAEFGLQITVDPRLTSYATGLEDTEEDEPLEVETTTTEGDTEVAPEAHSTSSVSTTTSQS